MTQQTLNITGDTVSTITQMLRTITVFNFNCAVNCFPAHTGVHVTLDSLLKDTDLKSTIKTLVSSSGRSVPVGEDNYNKKQGVANGSVKINP